MWWIPNDRAPPVLMAVRVAFAAATSTTASVVAAAASASVVVAPSSTPQDILFMSPSDTLHPWGLQYQAATAVQPLPTTVVNVSLPLFAALEPSPLRPSDGFELFYLNGTKLMFISTPDLTGLPHHAKLAVQVFDLGAHAPPGWMCKPKTLGRSDDGQRYVFLAFCSFPPSGKCGAPPSIPGEGVHAFVSTDVRVPDSFKPRDPSGGMSGSIAFHDHDDQQLLWDSARGRFVISQVTFQQVTTRGYTPVDPAKQTMKFCDNAGCKFRRMISTRFSVDGWHWSNSSTCDQPLACNNVTGYQHICTAPGGWNATGALVPDRDDPPELEFYKATMFRLGKSSRLAAHALLYAPGPIEVLATLAKEGRPYGLMTDGKACAGKPPQPMTKGCHAPHMHLERWVGPPSGDPTDLVHWERPLALRRQKPRIAPPDTLLTVGPILLHKRAEAAQTLPGRNASVFDTWHVWPGEPTFAVPLYRLVGIYAPANAEFSTHAFAWPSKENGLTLNAAARWGADSRYVEHCDEECAAYIMVEAQDAATNKVLPGYEREKCVLIDVDSLALPLRWDNAPPLAAKKQVSLRIFFRDATIFSLSVSK